MSCVSKSDAEALSIHSFILFDKTYSVNKCVQAVQDEFVKSCVVFIV